MMFKAVLSSKSFIGEYSSYTENWAIKADQKRFIVMEFREFDIGCGSGSRLEIESASESMRRFCNQNKPMHSIRSSHSSLIVRFNFEKRDSYLIEGFRAVYEFQARDDALLPYPSLEEQGISKIDLFCRIYRHIDRVDQYRRSLCLFRLNILYYVHVSLIFIFRELGWIGQSINSFRQSKHLY